MVEGACMALWRRLDTPGHDAAQVLRSASGWTLRGAAVFKADAGPACIHYQIELTPAWVTRVGYVRGFIAQRQFEDVIAREEHGWTFNGRLVAGLDHTLDLDLGFTPATNLQQLRRVPLGVGAAADIAVAWLDAGARTLTPLPQRYERVSEFTYAYRAPAMGYSELLELAPSGFVARYPGLWELVA